MPIAPATAAPASTAAASEAPSQVVGGFDELLAASTPAAARLPTVSLGQMVAAFASGDPLATVGGIGGAAPSAPGADPDGVGLAGTSTTTPAPSLAGASVGGPGAAVLEAGERYLGVPYKWGGTSASTGFDCSGFVQQVYADLGVSLPRVSVDQSRAGSPVASLAEAQPGDLVFWRATGGRPNHIGIYAGDGQMLVAPRTGDVVRYQEISRTPDAIRRVVA